MEFLIREGNCKTKSQLKKCIKETLLFYDRVDYHGNVETNLQYRDLNVKLIHIYNKLRPLRENKILINGKEYSKIKAYIEIIKY